MAAERTTSGLPARIRPATVGDVDDVVRIHTAAFAGFVLTRLGPAFLRQYYRAVLDYEGGVLLLAERSGSTAGFVAGFARPAGFSRLLRRRIVRLAPSIISGVLHHPGLVAIVAANAWGVMRSRSPAPEHQADEAELSSLAVAPSAQRAGLGGLLIGAFIEAAHEHGAVGVYLCTDADENESVNRFYTSHGFQLTATFRASGGRLRNDYVWRPTETTVR